MDIAIEAPDWRTLDQETRDRAFNNSAAVADSAEILRGWAERSAALRAQCCLTLDLPYGPGPRNRIDFLKAGEHAPTLVFIHGGYWQMRAKEDFTFCAAGPLAHGINVAFMGYTLAPDATIDDISQEIRTGLRHLTRELPALGGDVDRVFLSGWSAGGHLAVMNLDHPLIKGGLAISGVFDLEPMRHIYINAKLGLDEAAVARNSPTLLPGRGAVPLILVAGSGELPLMRKQTADFAAHRAAQGLPLHYEEIPDANHFTILETMAEPSGRIAQLITALVKGVAL